MRKFFTGLARILAGMSSILFIITALIALIFFNGGRQIFNADFYKNALSDLDVYETLPALIGSVLTSGFSINPCTENPIVCEDIPLDLRTCYEQAFDRDRYLALASGQEQPSDAEKRSIESCLDQYGGTFTTDTEDFNLQTASAEVQDCAKQTMGETIYNELYSQQRPPTMVEQQQIASCFNIIGMADSSSDGGMPSYFQNITAQNWEAILRIILPPDQMEVMVESILDNIFAFLNGDIDRVKVSLVALKNRLSGPAGEDLIMQIINSQPPCTEEDLAQLIGAAGNEGMVLCKPPEDLLVIIIPILQQQLKDVVTQLPEEAMLVKPNPTDPSSSGVGPLGNDPIAAIRVVRLILHLTPLLPLVFLLLVTLFGVRSLKGWMRWWGIPFFITGFISIGLGFLSPPAISKVWSTFVAPRMPAFLTVGVTDIVRKMVLYLAHDLTEHIVFQALILLVFGLAAWIGSNFITTKIIKEESFPPTPVAG